MKREIVKEVDLDFIIMSTFIYCAWMSQREKVGPLLLKKFPDLNPIEVSIEKFRVYDDGSGSVYVKARNLTIEMPVPKEHWSYNSKNN